MEKKIIFDAIQSQDIETLKRALANIESLENIKYEEEAPLTIQVLAQAKSMLARHLVRVLIPLKSGLHSNSNCTRLFSSSNPSVFSMVLSQRKLILHRV